MSDCSDDVTEETVVKQRPSSQGSDVIRATMVQSPTGRFKAEPLSFQGVRGL